MVVGMQGARGKGQGTEAVGTHCRTGDVARGCVGVGVSQEIETKSVIKITVHA